MTEGFHISILYRILTGLLKQRLLDWMGYVASMEEIRNKSNNMLGGKSKLRHYFGDIIIERKIILKFSSKKYDVLA
jgi:hypothetical protein